VLDVGCGSGILAIASLLLGAARVTAIDIDPDAVRVACENAQVNAVADRLEASTTPLGELDGSYPLVLANIETRVLVPHAAELLARVEAGGTLLLSGILLPEEERVRHAYAGCQLLAAPRDGEWVALALRVPG
jgi:ribosomal protein L11 methyltransferase